MSEFINILTHGRRLKAATKNLSVSELEEVQQKLEKVISDRREEAEVQRREEQEKAQKIEEFKKAMADAGIDVSDIIEKEIGGDAIKKPRKKRAPKPPKYAIVENGERITWTGQGRMPNALKHALEKGNKLEDYLIK
ncbi:H-NS family nucleoid-associated regulatory protein [Idiomarina xiamenensis]|uniref:DNA-binding protein n=1 Tax=Idiomarina xiamenensis 10-D-4 TaxID=740709 RepID=K2KAM4_9GAMM|nr:H-NS family nucleoid-associated regulatory protein [Idiomarina xiamenensis]EKE84893.1 histone-like protein [Idiomarina xiamenensis 10-D-4]